MKAWITEEIKNSPSIIWIVRWYKGLDRKQRVMVNLLLSAASCFFFFTFFVSSGIDNLAEKNQEHTKSALLYEAVKKNVVELSQLTTDSIGVIDRQSSELQTVIGNNLKRYEIEPDSISIIGSSKVSLEFLKVSFQEFSQFIKAIEDERVKIASFDIEPKANGKVNSSLVLD